VFSPRTISPVTFLISLFNDNWYNFGFMIGCPSDRALRQAEPTSGHHERNDP